MGIPVGVTVNVTDSPSNTIVVETPTDTEVVFFIVISELVATIFPVTEDDLTFTTKDSSDSIITSSDAVIEKDPVLLLTVKEPDEGVTSVVFDEV